MRVSQIFLTSLIILATGCSYLEKPRLQFVEDSGLSEPPDTIFITRWGKNPEFPEITSCGEGRRAVVIKTINGKGGRKTRVYSCEPIAESK